jgi:hypothetical protein
LSVEEKQLTTDDDELTSGDLLPGFRCRISDLSQHPARA